MRCSSSSAPSGCAKRCATRCGGAPISSARWRGWRSAAAARAISRRCATRCAYRPACARLLRQADFTAPPPLIAALERDLGEHTALVERLARALAAELPLLARDGGFIAPGYAPELDELRELRDDSRRSIAALQARYAAETGIASLKIRHNNVLGYYIEVSAAECTHRRWARSSSIARRWRRDALHDGRARRARKRRSPPPPTRRWRWS